MEKIQKILKSDFFIYSIATILTVLIAFSFVWGLSRGKEGYSIKVPFLFFIIFGGTLLFWLIYNKKILSILLLFFFISIQWSIQYTMVYNIYNGVPCRHHPCIIQT